MAKEKKEKAPINYGQVWAERVFYTIIIALIASIANTIYGWRTAAETILPPWAVFPCLLYMVIIIFFSYAVHDLLEKVLPFTVPAVLYIALFGAILSFPSIDGALGGIFGLEGGLMATTFSKFYGLLPLCTPTLAFAGIASGKELKTFKEQGIAIVVVAILTFVGTYLGSALIAQIIMKAQGII